MRAAADFVSVPAREAVDRGHDEEYEAGRVDAAPDPLREAGPRQRRELHREEQVAGDDSPGDRNRVPLRRERDQDRAQAEVRVLVGEQAEHVHAGERERGAAQPAVHVEQPVRAGPAPEHLGRERETPQGRRREQRPRHEAGRARDVPGQCSAQDCCAHDAFALLLEVVGDDELGKGLGEVGGEPGRCGDAAVAIDRERGGAVGRDEVEGHRRSVQQERLGEHFGRPGVAGDDGHERQVALRRPAGGRVDEVMLRLAVDCPPRACSVVDVATAPRAIPMRAIGRARSG